MLREDAHVCTACVCAYMYAYALFCVPVCEREILHIYTSFAILYSHSSDGKCIFLNVDICVRVCMCTCVLARIYTCVDAHVHTYVSKYK